MASTPNKRRVKKTVAPKPPVVDAAATETPAAPIPLPVATPEQPPSGPVNLQPDADRKVARLLQKLIVAEEESANYAAIADGLLEQNNNLKKQVQDLTNHVRALEKEMFADKEEASEDDSEPQE